MRKARHNVQKAIARPTPGVEARYLLPLTIFSIWLEPRCANLVERLLCRETPVGWRNAIRQRPFLLIAGEEKAGRDRRYGQKTDTQSANKASDFCEGKFGLRGSRTRSSCAGSPALRQLPMQHQFAQ